MSAEHVATAAGPEDFPRQGLDEVAFLGRSNSGKSSLLNRLVGRRRLAHTSRAPGKTRLLQFYCVRRQGGGTTRELLLVDLPGYGFARVSRAERNSWRRLIEGYLEGREPLRAAVLLHEIRREVSEDELDLVAWLAERRIPLVVALTKADKLKPTGREARIRALRAAFELPAARVVPTSAASGLGMAELWRAVDLALEH